jgi:L-fuconolactonase
MRIDAHQHFWKYDAARYAWITEEMSLLKRDFMPEEFAREGPVNGIDGSVAVQTHQSEDETHFLLNLAESSDRIAAVVGWVDLCSPKLANRLEYFSNFPKLRGFRHIAQSEPDDRFLVRGDFLRGVAQLAAFSFAYDILIYPKQLRAALELVEKYPEQRFVIDHLAKPEIKTKNIQMWAGLIRKIATNPNVFCKLSGLVTEADWHRWKMADLLPYLDVAFEAFGPDRLMFGSDWPVCLLAASYADVKGVIDTYLLNSSPEQKERVFGGTAAEFYRLPS